MKKWPELDFKPLVLLLLCIGATLLGTNQPTIRSLFRRPGADRTVATLPQVLRANKSGYFVIVDVRDESAFRAGHIPHAVNIPSEGLRSHVGILKTATNVIIYGAGDDMNVFRAEKILWDLGVTDKSSTYSGGWEEWSECGLPKE